MENCSLKEKHHPIQAEYDGATVPLEAGICPGLACMAVQLRRFTQRYEWWNDDLGKRQAIRHCASGIVFGSKGQATLPTMQRDRVVETHGGRTLLGCL